MAIKLLLDTDIGSDIDDAVCLAYLLAQKECNLLGITTVTGEAEKRAAMASVLCKIAGKEIPIYPGCENPLLVQQQQPLAPQASALSKWAHQSEFQKGEAIEFLRKTIHSNPGEVTLLAIGPLTNVALLFSSDPEIPKLLKELVLMCGVFTDRFEVDQNAEWNAKLDPHATAIVFRAPVKIHRSIGLDVTLQTGLLADEVRKKFTVPLLLPVLDFAEVWFRHTEKIIFHDPLAGTTIFNDQICAFEKGKVDVDFVHEPGRTHWLPGAGEGLHEVATSVDVELFYRHYFSTLGCE
jgi:purine nucleosidase